MSDIESVVLRTRRLEKLLRQQYRADGKGLHQLVSSCEERLPHDIINKLRYIATIRNQMIHEDDFELELDDKSDFMRACDECEQELTPRSSRFIWRTAMWLMALITLLAMGFYYMHWEKVLHILSK